MKIRISAGVHFRLRATAQCRPELSKLIEAANRVGERGPDGLIRSAV
jgi:hypothetical protein